MCWECGRVLPFLAYVVLGKWSCVASSWEDRSKHLFTPDKEPGREQNTDTVKVQLGEPMSFINVCAEQFYVNLTQARII